jgi:hypothetical protein
MYAGPLHTIIRRSEGPGLLSAGGGQQPLPERTASPLREGQGAVQLTLLYLSLPASHLFHQGHYLPC